MRQTRRAFVGSLAAVGASGIALTMLANRVAPRIQTPLAVKPRRIGFVTARAPTKSISLLRTLPELGGSKVATSYSSIASQTGTLIACPR
jgi:hypothetical protein